MRVRFSSHQSFFKLFVGSRALFEATLPGCQLHMDRTKRYIRGPRCLLLCLITAPLNIHPSFKSTHIKLSPDSYQSRPSPTNMQFFNVLTVAFLFAGTALAVPGYHPPKPSRPNKVTVYEVQQANQCGNTDTVYCCNADNGSKYTSCTAKGK